jgi:hypothetical protein
VIVGGEGSNSVEKGDRKVYDLTVCEGGKVLVKDSADASQSGKEAGLGNRNVMGPETGKCELISFFPKRGQGGFYRGKSSYRGLGEAKNRELVHSSLTTNPGHHRPSKDRPMRRRFDFGSCR